MTNTCPLCDKPVNQDDPKAWKQVIGWVGGPRKDSMRLRQDTGYFAHNECVRRAQEGLTTDDSVSLFDEPLGSPLSSWSPLPEELM